MRKIPQNLPELYAALVAQGGPSIRDPEGPQCAYRAANGRMCAVGMLIRDDAYSKRMEGNSAKHLLREFGSGILAHRKISDADLLSAQLAHDGAAQYMHDLRLRAFKAKTWRAVLKRYWTRENLPL